MAQAASQSELELCASQESAELKLACFEALTARYNKDEQASAETPAPPEPAERPPAVSEAPVIEKSPGPPTPAESNEEDNEVFTATVVKVERDRRLRRHTFVMENGDVWRQMESGMLYYPKDGPFEVEIRQGFMGDYQMRIGGDGRLTRIVRLR